MRIKLHTLTVRSELCESVFSIKKFANNFFPLLQRQGILAYGRVEVKFHAS